MPLIKNIQSCLINGVRLIELNLFADERGHFALLFSRQEMRKAKLKPYRFCYFAESSSKQGVVRAFHIARYTKYIHITWGCAHAAIMDCRLYSPTFGQIVTFTLDEHNVLILPPNCGNGFQALTPTVKYLYAATGYWTPTAERGVSYQEHRWPLPPIVSERDRNYLPFVEAYRKEIERRMRSRKSTLIIVRKALSESSVA
ncbi:MAG: dTDP-4-dehydrorhamnose 3,5-epimerase [Candidatus Andersenbacteria bacterium]